MKTNYDVAVIGCGGVGSAALYSLASRGLRVVGIDKYSPPHAYGSSHGQTRVIRKAYFEHPNYVPLLIKSYKLWGELERKSTRQLMNLTGVLEIGPTDGVLIDGVRQSAKLPDLPVEFLSSKEASELYPGLYIPDHFEAAFEKDAGYLRVEQSVDSFINLATSLGANLYTNTHVLDWSASSNGVQIKTTNGLIEADSLIISGGPWASSLLGDIDEVCLELRKKHMYWYSNNDQSYLSTSGFPVFAFELPVSDGVRFYYGFPQIDSNGVKIAEHTRGILVDSADTKNVTIDPEAGDTEEFRKLYLPGITGEVCKHETCFYTVSHDENFYLDVHPQHENVVYAAGLSGHGFKFVPVLGEILADLATQVELSENIEFLRASAGRRK